MTTNRNMNPLRLLIILFTIVIVTSFVSCSDDLQKPNYRISSIEEVMVEAEHSSVDIQMTESDWIITGIYSPDGHTITDGNKPLQLAGLGTLDSRWFKITRDELSSLKVDVFENYDDTQRGMVIKIEKGSHTEEIKIVQITSQGYEFKEIKYSFKEKTTFTRGQASPKLTYNNYSEEGNSVGMYPYSSQKEVSTFISEERGAFSWVAEEGVEVDIPVPSIEKHFYKKATSYHPSQLNDINFTVTVAPLKQTKVSLDLEYLKQVYDYTLIVVNNRTQEEKEIKGEWIIEQPISYTETLELSELPEQ